MLWNHPLSEALPTESEVVMEWFMDSELLKWGTFIAVIAILFGLIEYLTRKDGLPTIEIEYTPFPRTKKVKGMDNALLEAGKLIRHGNNVESVNDEFVAGACENCSRAILEDEPYNRDEDGILWHQYDCLEF